MAAYAQLRRTQAPPRCSLDAVVVVASLPRVERDDGAAVRSFLRDASLRAGASIVEVRGPFAHENGTAAFVETGSNEAAQSVSRALDGFRVQEPARCTIRAAPYRLTTSVNAPPPPQRMPQVSAILRSSTVSSSDEGPPVPRRQRVETLTGALDRARGPSAPVLAQLDGDLDAAMAQGDSKRCREVEARITRAYSAMLGGLRQLCESGRDDTDVERERGALDAVERALLRGAFRSGDDDESDDEVVLLRGALKAERPRAAALAKEARAHAVRAAALTQDARERREVLQRFSRRAEDLTAITQQLQDRCDRAERRADVAERRAARAAADGRRRRPAARERARARGALYATRRLPGRPRRLPRGAPAAAARVGHVRGPERVRRRAARRLPLGRRRLGGRVDARRPDAGAAREAPARRVPVPDHAERHGRPVPRAGRPLLRAAGHRAVVRGPRDVAAHESATGVDRGRAEPRAPQGHRAVQGRVRRGRGERRPAGGPEDGVGVASHRRATSAGASCPGSLRAQRVARVDASDAARVAHLLEDYAEDEAAGVAGGARASTPRWRSSRAGRPRRHGAREAVIGRGQHRGVRAPAARQALRPAPRPPRCGPARRSREPADADAAAACVVDRAPTPRTSRRAAVCDG